MSWTILDWMYALYKADRRLEAASHPTNITPRPTSERQQVDQATVTAQAQYEADFWMGSEQHAKGK